MKHEIKHPAEGSSGDDGDGGKWVSRKLTGEYRADGEDAIAVAASGARLIAIAPLLQGVSNRGTQLEYLRLAVQFDEIALSCQAIAEGLRIRAEMKPKGPTP